MDFRNASSIVLTGIAVSASLLMWPGRADAADPPGPPLHAVAASASVAITVASRRLCILFLLPASMARLPSWILVDP